MDVRNAVKTLMIFFALISVSQADDLVYEGPWVTTEGRKLNGRMTAVVTSLGDQKWKGRFYGVWHGVKFDYTVPFTGSPDNLKGKAVIDGASYKWNGKLATETPGWFKATFTGSRYGGYFDMKQKIKKE